MNKKTTILTIILALLLTTAIVASTSQASEKRFKQGEKQNFQPGNFEEINQAMENNDYAAWKELMGDNPITEKITQDNFAKFVQAHELMREGQVEEAKAIHEELGIPGIGFRKGGRGMQPQNQTELFQAMENNDYAAWKELMGDNPITEKITQDNFAKFVQAHELMREGQVEEAKAIHEELGLQGPERRGLKGDKEGDFRGNRGQKPCTEFVDADGDGVCDNK